jgi:hypothetical protein
VVESRTLYLSEKGSLKRSRLEYKVEVSDGVRPPKLRKMVQEASHALRGVTNGSLWVDSSDYKVPCLVIGNAFSSWLFHVHELGYRVDQVLVKSPLHVNLIHKICGDTVPVWCGGDLEGVVSALSLHRDVTVCFLDGRITGGLLEALAAVGIEEVVSTQTPRRFCRGWNSTFIVVPHFAVGGVTTRIVTIVRHSKTPLSDVPAPLEFAAQRDATTVLSHATFGRYFRPKPVNTVVDPLRCLNLGTIANPFYHGHGWLPGVLSRGLRVLTPVLNSLAHKGQWGLRTISGEEILLCNDIGSSTVSLLLPNKPNQSFYSILVPGKCLLAGFISLFHGGVSGSGKAMHNKCEVKVKLGSTTWVSTTSGLGIEGSTEGPPSAVPKANWGSRREVNEVGTEVAEGSSEGSLSKLPKVNLGSTMEVNALGMEVKGSKFLLGSTIAVEEPKFILGSMMELSTSKGVLPLDPCGLGLGLDLDSLAREKKSVLRPKQMTLLSLNTYGWNICLMIPHGSGTSI